LAGHGEATAPVVVFDFDLTLTRWDTADRFFRWLLRRDAWRMAVVGLAVPVLGPLMLLRKTRRMPVRFAVWIATLGQGRDLPALVDAHLAELARQQASVFMDAALAQLHSHLRQGHRVVVATGCFEALARALLDRAGLAQVPLVASTLRPRLGGLVVDQHCFGANKIPMLAARGFAPPWSMAYTDHHADLPVLSHSLERLLVNPKPRCLARIRERLSTGTTILAWR
jgi:phosphatidylglycerophosphatase C